jgi:hypothetical protein
MRVVKVEPLGDFYARVTFARGEDQVSKAVRISNCARRVLKPESYPVEFLLSIENAAREANRDMIIREVGTNNVRQHPDWNQRFSDLATDVAALI